MADTTHTSSLFNSVMAPVPCGHILAVSVLLFAPERLSLAVTDVPGGQLIDTSRKLHMSYDEYSKVSES